MILQSSPSRPLIVLDALLVTRQPTGVGRSILELLRALSQQDRGFDFLVLATEPEMFNWLDGLPGWEVLPCPDARGGVLRKSLFTQFRIPGICSRYGAAILHSLQFVAPLRLGCSSVVTVHDLGYLRFPGTVEEPRRSYYRFFVPRTLKRAACIVTNSQATAEDVASCFPSVREKITPTFFGTPSWVTGRTSGHQAQPGERPFFLFVGTLEPRKNLENLLIAYDQFLAGAEARSRPQSEVPSLVFIGGKGWSDSRLRKRIGDFVALGHLEVRDYCDANELWHFYRTAHALLFPSLHEGFGFPILEAMAAGLPVLTSQRGAMAEVGGKACVLVEPDDPAEMAAKMASIAWDQPLRSRLREEGLLRSQEWSWGRTADQTVDVYRRLAPLNQIK